MQPAANISAESAVGLAPAIIHTEFPEVFHHLGELTRLTKIHLDIHPLYVDKEKTSMIVRYIEATSSLKPLTIATWGPDIWPFPSPCWLLVVDSLEMGSVIVELRIHSSHLAMRDAESLGAAVGRSRSVRRARYETEEPWQVSAFALGIFAHIVGNRTPWEVEFRGSFIAPAPSEWTIMEEHASKNAVTVPRGAQDEQALFTDGGGCQDHEAPQEERGGPCAIENEIRSSVRWKVWQDYSEHDFPRIAAVFTERCRIFRHGYQIASWMR